MSVILERDLWFLTHKNEAFKGNLPNKTTKGSEESGLHSGGISLSSWNTSKTENQSGLNNEVVLIP